MNAFYKITMKRKKEVTMSRYQKLFEPTRIGKLKLKNRTSMAPMGPVGYADPASGAFTQRIQDYYVERARHGVGLIITGYRLRLKICRPSVFHVRQRCRLHLSTVRIR